MNASAGRLLLTIPSLRGGGSERVFALVAEGLSQRGFDVHLALAQREGPWLERLPKSVAVHDLKAPNVRAAAWPLWRLVRKLQPATVLSTMTHMNKLVGLVRSAFPARTRVVLREATFRHLDRSIVPHRPGTLHRVAYRAADAIICLTDSMRDAVHREFEVPRGRLVRIYNPIEESTPPSPVVARRPGGPHIVSIGRMDESKGFDRIIEAFPECLKQHPEATLTLVGNGPDHDALKIQAAALGVQDHVHMPGFDPDVRSRLAAADLFVLASRFEGLPNVLLEAIDAETPVVVRDHPGGTREVLERLGQTHRMTSDLSEWKRDWFERPPPNVRETALRIFGLSKIVDEYAAVLCDEQVRQRSAA